jgi:hypothetical protein
MAHSTNLSLQRSASRSSAHQMVPGASTTTFAEAVALGRWCLSYYPNPESLKISPFVWPPLQLLQPSAQYQPTQSQ